MVAAPQATVISDTKANEATTGAEAVMVLLFVILQLLASVIVTKYVPATTLIRS